jgi:hypothetical protein
MLFKSYNGNSAFNILMSVIHMFLLRGFKVTVLLVFVMVPSEYSIVLRQLKILLLIVCSSMS